MTVFNPINYGAKGNGVTVDTVAVQKCIDAAHAYQLSHGGDAFVQFPPLTFLLDGNANRYTDLYRPPGNYDFYGVKTYSHIHIRGLPGATLKLPWVDLGFPHTLCALTNNAADDSNFSVAGLSFDGGYAGIVHKLKYHRGC